MERKKLWFVSLTVVVLSALSCDVAQAVTKYQKHTTKANSSLTAEEKKMIKTLISNLGTEKDFNESQMRFESALPYTPNAYEQEKIELNQAEDVLAKAHKIGFVRPNVYKEIERHIALIKNLNRRVEQVEKENAAELQQLREQLNLAEQKAQESTDTLRDNPSNWEMIYDKNGNQRRRLKFDSFDFKNRTHIIESALGLREQLVKRYKEMLSAIE